MGREAGIGVEGAWGVVGDDGGAKSGKLEEEEDIDHRVQEQEADSKKK